MRLLIVAVLGCNHAHTIAADASAVIDVPPLDAYLGFCDGWGPFELCSDTLPIDAITLATGAIDTDTSPLCASDQDPLWKANGQPDACFIIGTTVTIPAGAQIAVTGSRPIVLVGTGTTAGNGQDGMIIVGGAIDVSSHATASGPGADADACSAGGAPSVAGGGAGGSFYSQGGLGGGATGGQPAAAAASVRLRGGCAGEAGDPNGGVGGAGGLGGGAIYFASSGAFVMLDGSSLDASGQGGGGGSAGGAGGGGGSGGMIVVFAGLIAVPPTAFVLGDGGGGGGGATIANDGTAGSDAVPGVALPTGASAVAPGGQGCFFGAASAPGSASDANGGGGGGGGGCGYVLTSENDFGG